MEVICRDKKGFSVFETEQREGEAWKIEDRCRGRLQCQTLTKEEEIASKAKSTVGRGQHPEEETTGVWTGGSWVKRAAQRPRGATRWGCWSSCWADMQG